MKLSTPDSHSISIVTHFVLLLFLVVPLAQGLKIRSLTSSNGQQQHERDMFLAPFLFGEEEEDENDQHQPAQISASCPEAIDECKARHEPGSLSYEGWSNFLQKLDGGEDESSNNPEDDDETVIGKLRNIVDLANQLGSPADTYQQVLDDLANDDVATVVKDLVALQQGAADGDEIQETNILSLGETLGQIPIVGPVLQILFTIITFPINLAFSIFFFGALLIYCPFDPDFYFCPNKETSGGAVMETYTSDDCQAELFSCELEAFLFDAIPAILQQAFIESGSL